VNYFLVFVVSFFALFLSACNPHGGRTVFSKKYDATNVPNAPAYEDDANWTALPWVEDKADLVAKGSSLSDQQETATVDVFFIYPTIYTDKPKRRFPWNASVTDKKLNKSIDNSTIRQQASIFNAAGRVYSPRYRQAHISAYYTPVKATEEAAFNLAYEDIKNAFEYYLANYNEGRPIIIAGHSQGTTHGKRLVREYFDGKPLADQLVAAYLVGIAVPQDYFTDINICKNATQTGCFVSWRSWQRPAAPWTEGNLSFGESGNPPFAAVVNPLTWKTTEEYAPASLNEGGTLLKFKVKKERSDAQIHRGILWINKPKFFPNFLVNMDNWHVADLNLFYESVRSNAVLRVNSFQGE